MSRMNDQKIPKKLLFGQVANERRISGRPALSWEKRLESGCKSRNINNWVSISKNRMKWRNLVTSRASRCRGAHK